MMENENIRLRLPIVSDLNTLMLWENDEQNWEVSDTAEKYDKETMLSFILSKHDFHAQKQLRLMICKKQSNTLLGTLDLFHYNQINGSCSIGILIGDLHHRKKGYAFEAISLLMDSAPRLWDIKELHASMFATNIGSIKLFTKLGFSENTGAKAEDGKACIEMNFTYGKKEEKEN